MLHFSWSFRIYHFPPYDCNWLDWPFKVFHCLRQAPIGGESILVDGFSVAEKFKKSYPEYFQILQTTPIEHRYFEGYDIEDKIIDSAPLKLYARCVEPIINCDGDKLVQIR